MGSFVQSRVLLVTHVGSLALVSVLGACSSSNDGGSTSASPDSGNEEDGAGGADGGRCTDAHGDSGRTVTVYNFDSWCSVSLDGASASVSPSYEACAPSGNSVPIVVGPASSTFELGPRPFVGVSGLELALVNDASALGTVVGDGGAGSTSTLQVGVSVSSGCVLVCCPFANGTGCDPSQSGYSAFLANCP